MRSAGVRRLRLATAFASTVERYWLSILPRARRELRWWRQRADAIPDPALRRDALTTLQTEHRNAEGAALFAALAPASQRSRVVRLLVAFQSMYDYLDTLTEQPTADPLANGRQLHRALTVALDPNASHVDYYARHLHRDDGRYLRAHIDACRGVVASLPSYPAFAAAARRAAAISAEGQSLNHAGLRGSHEALARWAGELAPPSAGLHWWELAAATLSTLGIHALLATAADPAASEREATAIEAAYFPWITALNTLLDSVVDQPDDAITGRHSLVARYASPAEAADRLGALASRSRRLTRSLPRAEEHAVILAGMVSYYVSAPEASAPESRQAARGALEPMGALSKWMFLVLRVRQGADSAARLLPGRSAS